MNKTLKTFLFTLLMLLGMLAWNTTAIAQRLEPLPIENAFNFAASVNKNDIAIQYSMPSGIYLYKDKINIQINSDNVKLNTAIIPDGEILDDPFFGRTTVFFNAITLIAKTQGSGNLTLVVHSQGCDKETGICYPPTQNSVALLIEDAASFSSSDNPIIKKDKANDLADSIDTSNIFWTILIFFALGVGLSLTPCVLPMIPILLGIIGGGPNNTNRKNSMSLTSSYVAGVVLIFTITGVLAASSGQLLATQVQTPPFLIAISIIFILLALSMFGLYDIKAPAIFHRFYDNAGKKGGMMGAFIMGGLSVIVISPCISAPLVAVLIYIANTGNKVIGAISLLSLSLGMSTLLLALGFFGNKILPQPGEWMIKIKYILGLMLLLVAVWTASPLIDSSIQSLLYGSFLIIMGLLGAPFNGLSATNNFLFFMYKALAWIALLLGSVLLVSGFNAVNPLPNNLTQPTEKLSANPLHFNVVKTLDGLQQLTTTTSQPIMIEFYADWCVSCKEFEYYTLGDSRVQDKLLSYRLIKVDVTANSDESKKLLKHFNLFGPPGIFFYTEKGVLIETIRIIGYENSDEFLQTLNLVEQKNNSVI